MATTDARQKSISQNPPRRRATAAVVAVAVALATALLAFASATSASAAPTTDRKGPIGWETYRNLDRVSAVTTGVETKQFSSFDRTGGNEDGFAGVYSCLRQDNGCVIAEHSGPGEVASIWFTRDEGDVSRTGNIRVELDGTTVLDAPLQDVVNGTLGGGFVYPFVANADQSSGGVFIKVPMTFRSSMKVTTQNNPLFYHVTYRTFSDANGVTTFNPGSVPADVIAASKTWGQKDPKPAKPNTSTQNASFSLAPGQAKTVASTRGPGEVTEMKLTLPQLTAPPALPYITDDGRATRNYTQFTVAIDPNNQGVKLTRRFDAASNHQVADVYLGDTKVAQWPATDDTPGTWSYQTITIPAQYTAGRSSLTLRNQFVSGSIDWNEFHYWVDSVVNGADVRTDELDVGASPAALASERAHAYVITNQTWQGTARQTDKPSNPNDPAVLASNEVLRNVYIRATFDGNQTVEAPLGEFFSSGLQEASVASMFLKVDPAADTFTSWWPMPFISAATVELVNRSSQTVSSASAAVSLSRDGGVARDLAGVDPSIGYFNGTHHRGDVVNGQDWIFLQTGGTGRFVGVSQTVHGKISTGNIREYLEGDERVYTDGSRTPAIHGTGSEDFYEAGWYFNRGPFSTPTNGLSAMPTQSYGCQYQCDAPYRLMIGDAVPFRAGITFGIEHGPVDNAPAEYSSTAYWYGFGDKAGAHVSDTVDLGDAANRAQHAYTGAPADQSLTATFEGDHDDQPITDTVASTTSPQSFTVSLDPTNTAVTLRRTSDQARAYQSAAVTVDGKPAGTWLQPLGNASHRWLDDTFQLDPALTANKVSVRVTITPTAGAPAWSAAQYQVLSSRRLSSDNRDPGAVTGLTATGTASNAIQLSWNAATDNVGVDHYEIYGAKGTSVTPSQTTLLGTSTLPAFTHTGIGLKETWTYVVRAVDAAGNAGPYSSPATATSGDTLRLEGESLLPPVRTTDPAVAQGNCCGVSWSGGQQLWFQGNAQGDTVTLNFSVPQGGSYAATAALTSAADYGIVQLSVDGAPVGAPIDKYQPAGVGVADTALGTVQLAAGQHTLTLTMTGKNPAAVNYFAGLDVLSLKLTG